MSNDAYENENGDEDDDSDDVGDQFPWAIFIWILAFVSAVVSIITGIVFYLTMWRKG